MVDGAHRPVVARRILLIAGRLLIATGVMLLGFVAYQLWGTGIETARSQRALTERFNEQLEQSQAPATPATTAPETTAPPADEPPGVIQDVGPIEIGDPIAILQIPRLGVGDALVAGVGVDELKTGPGHFPETPLPGQFGRAAIAGHRTSYGQPFRHIDRLAPGDEIITTTLAGRFVYRVIDTEIVDPTAYEVIRTTDPGRAELVLISCHPAFTTDQRMIVTALLDETASDPIGRSSTYLDFDLLGWDPATAPGMTDGGLTDDGPADAGAGTPSDDAANRSAGEATELITNTAAIDTTAATSLQGAFGTGWFSDPDAAVPLALWGLGLIAIALGSWQVSRRTGRNLYGLGIGIAPFFVASFFFFQNLSRLMPPGF